MAGQILDEAALVDGAVAGSAEAFGQLYLQLRDPIYRYIYARVGDQSDAEDLTSQVFLKAWEAIGRYERRESRFASWLFRIAHNTIVDYLRAKPHEPCPLVLDRADPPEHQRSAIDLLIAAEESKHLDHAIAQLPEVQRKVIRARFFDERSYPEIAQLVAKSMGACRVIQHRALNNLNQFLKSTLSVALIVTLLLTGSLYASEGALPGDLNYPVKRIVEHTQFAVAADDVATSSLHLTFGLRRLAEIDELIRLGRNDDITATIHEYVGQLDALLLALHNEGPQAADIAAQILATWGDHERQLTLTGATAPPAAVPLIAEARSRAEAVHQRALEVLRDSSADEPAPGPAPTSAPESSIGPPVTPTPSPGPSASAGAPPPEQAALSAPPSSQPTATPAPGWPPQDMSATATASSEVPTATAPPDLHPRESPVASEPGTSSHMSPTPTLSVSPTPTATPAATVAPAVPPAPPNQTTPTPPASETPTSTAPPPQISEPTATDTPTPPTAPPVSPPPPDVPALTPIDIPWTMPSGLLPGASWSGPIGAQLLPPVLALEPGEGEELSLLIANRSQDLVEVEVIISLPKELDYVAGSATAGGAYDSASHTLTWEAAAAPPQEIAALDLRVSAREGTPPAIAALRATIKLNGADERSELEIQVLILPRV